jgi:hypothetical protein
MIPVIIERDESAGVTQDDYEVRDDQRDLLPRHREDTADHRIDHLMRTGRWRAGCGWLMPSLQRLSPNPQELPQRIVDQGRCALLLRRPNYLALASKSSRRIA